MSANMDVIARIQIGDAALSESKSVTTSAAEFTLSADLRGRVVEMTPDGGDVYLSAKGNGEISGEAGDPSPTAGVSIADGESKSFFIPDGRGPYYFKAEGSASLTLKVDLVSP